MIIFKKLSGIFEYQNQGCNFLIVKIQFYDLWAIFTITAKLFEIRLHFLTIKIVNFLESRSLFYQDRGRFLKDQINFFIIKISLIFKIKKIKISRTFLLSVITLTLFPFSIATNF